MPLKTQIRQAPAREQQAEGLAAATPASSESRVMKQAWLAWGTGTGVHVWARWGSITEGYWLETVSGFFSVKQFSEPFPWNILTLKFKISAVAMGGAQGEEPKLVAGDCVCPQQCKGGPGTHCQAIMSRGQCLSVLPHRGFKGGFSVGTQAHGLHCSPLVAVWCPKELGQGH